MRAFIFLTAVLFIPGCGASSAQAGARTAPAESDLSIQFADGSTRGLTITRGARASRAEIIASRDEAWAAIPAAFQEIELPLPAVDRTRGLAIVQGHNVRSRLGGERLSRYFDCGRGATGLHADRGTMTLDVQIALLRDDELTVAEVSADAVVRSDDGTRSGTLPCTSTGHLEENLLVALQILVLQRASAEAQTP